MRLAVVTVAVIVRRRSRTVRLLMVSIGRCVNNPVMLAAWIAARYRETTYQNFAGFGSKRNYLRDFTAAFHAVLTRCAHHSVGHLAHLSLPVA